MASQYQVAGYINTQSIELRKLAIGSKFYELAFILYMVSLEASLQELQAFAAASRNERAAQKNLRRSA